MADNSSSVVRPLHTGPKRQHFPPEFYLDGFARGGLVAVYDRNQNTYRSQPPNNTAVVGHLYTFEDDAGRKRFEVEELFSKIEGYAAPVIESVAGGRLPSADDREAIAYFAAAALVRTPGMAASTEKLFAHLIGKGARDRMSTEAQAAQELATYAAETGAELTISPKEIFDFVHQGEYTIKIHKNIILAAMSANIKRIGDLFVQANWEIIRISSDRAAFITSDFPVSLFAREGIPESSPIGIATPGVVKTLALTSSVCLAMFEPGGKVRERAAVRERIRSINAGQALQSQRFLVARDAQLLRSVVKRTDLQSMASVEKFLPVTSEMSEHPSGNY